jgi:uncharacterized membrane protein
MNIFLFITVFIFSFYIILRLVIFFYQLYKKIKKGKHDAVENREWRRSQIEKERSEWDWYSKK